jgi:hypothetical protein
MAEADVPPPPVVGSGVAAMRRHGIWRALKSGKKCISFVNKTTVSTTHAAAPLIIRQTPSFQL